MSRVLMIDNFDSFTYNIVQALETAGATVTVLTNLATAAEAEDAAATHAVLSPGPGRPEAAGNLLAIVERLANDIPVLGVCLGHQALAVAMGGRVLESKRIVHGKASRVYHDNRTIYEGLPNPLEAGRYHSLTVDEDSLPEELEIASYTPQGEVMGIRHRSLPIEGIQFHPESVLTPDGDRLLGNFLDMALEGAT